MERLIKSVLKILVCSIIFIATGCSLTLGPVAEKKAIIVNAGTGIEVLEQIKVNCRILNSEDGEVDVFKQDIGGWITMHPDHWKSVKTEIKRLRVKCGEKD